MIKPTWWAMFKLALLLRDADLEDPTVSKGSRLAEMLAWGNFTDRTDPNYNRHDDQLYKEIVDTLGC